MKNNFLFYSFLYFIQARPETDDDNTPENNLMKRMSELFSTWLEDAMRTSVRRVSSSSSEGNVDQREQGTSAENTEELDSQGRGTSEVSGSTESESVQQSVGGETNETEHNRNEDTASLDSTDENWMSAFEEADRNQGEPEEQSFNVTSYVADPPDTSIDVGEEVLETHGVVEEVEDELEISYSEEEVMEQTTEEEEGGIQRESSTSESACVIVDADGISLAGHSDKAALDSSACSSAVDGSSTRDRSDFIAVSDGTTVLGECSASINASDNNQSSDHYQRQSSEAVAVAEHDTCSSKQSVHGSCDGQQGSTASSSSIDLGVGQGSSEIIEIHSSTTSQPQENTVFSAVPNNPTPEANSQDANPHSETSTSPGEVAAEDDYDDIPDLVSDSSDSSELFQESVNPLSDILGAEGTDRTDEPMLTSDQEEEEEEGEIPSAERLGRESTCV